MSLSYKERSRIFWASYAVGLFTGLAIGFSFAWTILRGLV